MHITHKSSNRGSVFRSAEHHPDAFRSVFQNCKTCIRAPLGVLEPHHDSSRLLLPLPASTRGKPKQTPPRVTGRYPDPVREIKTSYKAQKSPIRRRRSPPLLSVEIPATRPPHRCHPSLAPSPQRTQRTKHVQSVSRAEAEVLECERIGAEKIPNVGTVSSIQCRLGGSVARRERKLGKYIQVMKRKSTPNTAKVISKQNQQK